jgi:cardiolipin synthase (CMP-forming)
VSVNLPNTITLGRIILVPVIFWLLVSGNTRWAFIAFVAAGISDAIDGVLARRLKAQTELGSYLDPMADKLLITSIYIALGVAAKLPSWLVIAVVFRDILIVVGVLLAWVISRPMAMKPHAVSKWNTAAQLILAALVLADEGFGLGLALPREAMVWITGTLTLLSLALYLKSWVGHMAGAEPDHGVG